MKLPQSLLDAKAALETLMQRHDALQQRQSRIIAAGAQAAADIADLDRKIQPLSDAVVADDALAGIADDLRLAMDARAAIEAQLVTLRMERDDRDGQVKHNAAASVALARVIAERARDVAEPAGRYLTEWHALNAAFRLEFHHDLSRLALPQWMEKWFAIAAGLGHIGLLERLSGITISGNGPAGAGAIVSGGIRYGADDGSATDFKTSWRANVSLVELSNTLAAAAALACRVQAIGNAADEGRRSAAERARLDENQRQAREASRPKGFTTAAG